ncbi:MAG: TolC family protein, partial [Terracidiphilus sp.]
MTHTRKKLVQSAKAAAAILLLQSNLALAVEPPQGAPQPAAAVARPAPKAVPFNDLLRPSRNPFDTYRGRAVAPPSLDNSPRLDTLVRDGKLYLSLQDAIDLALENNLDLVIARYNLPIAQMDVLRTSAGGSVRGVNTGVVSGTPGGANGAFGGGNGAGA